MNILKYITTEVNLLLLLVLFVFADTLLFGVNINSFCQNIGFVFIISIFLVDLCKITKNSSAFMKYQPFFIIVFISMLVMALVNKTYSGGIFYQFILYVIAVYTVEKIPFTVFCSSFERIVFFLSYSSLVLFFLFQIGFRISPFFIIENINGISYNHYFVYSDSVDMFSMIRRNQSIFREPGVFMMYINLALLFNVIILKKGPKRNVVYYLTLLTTFSTSGILIGFIILYIQLLLKNMKAKYFWGAILLPLFLYLFVNAADNIYIDKIFGKLNKDNSSYGSTLARISSFYVPFEIFIHNILGVGFEKFDLLYRYYSQKIMGVELNFGMSTNYIVNMFARFGLLIGSMIVLFLINLSRLITVNKSLFITFIVFTILIMMLSAEDVASSAFFNILIIYGLKYMLYSGKNSNHFI